MPSEVLPIVLRIQNVSRGTVTLADVGVVLSSGQQCELPLDTPTPDMVRFAVAGFLKIEQVGAPAEPQRATAAPATVPAPPPVQQSAPPTPATSPEPELTPVEPPNVSGKAAPKKKRSSSRRRKVTASEAAASARSLAEKLKEAMTDDGDSK